MTKRKWSLRLIAAVSALALLAAACGDDGGGEGTPGTGDTTATTDGAAGKEGGTLIWTHEQEPPDLHLDDPNNNLTIASWMIQGMLDGLHGITGDTQFFPELLAEDAGITENDDGSVTGVFTLRDGLQWSDGDDLTADDVKFWYDVIMATGPDTDADEDTDPDFIYLIGDRTGYDTITDFTVDSPTQFTIIWSAFFAGYKSIFERIYPSHVFDADPATAAAQLNESLRDWEIDGEIIPSSGPLVFESWTKGEKMVLARNDNYAGSQSPDVENTGVAHVDAVEIRFVEDTDAQVNALKSGEAQVVMTQPQLAFEELATDEEFTVAALAGPVFEHVGANLFNKHLAKPEVREAFGLGLDKAQIMEGLYNKLFGDLLPTEGLGNTYWMSNQAEYEDHQGEAGYGSGDTDAAKAKLEEAGYTDSGDGIYEHPEDGRLTLRIGTTSGNALRELQEQLIQQNMKEAGFEIEIDNGDAADYFGSRPFSDGSLECASSGGTAGNCDIWDLTMFAWVGGPWPGGQTASYRTGSGNNAYGYSSEAFDARADECDATLDDAERGACYNELDTYVTTLGPDAENGLFMFPLTQKPSFYAYSNEQLAVGAVSPDADDAGVLVNVVDYQFKA